MHSDWFACRGLLIRKMTFFHFSDEWGSMGHRTCWNKSAVSTWLSTHLLRIWRVYVILRENGHATWTDWSYKIFFPLSVWAFCFCRAGHTPFLAMQCYKMNGYPDTSRAGMVARACPSGTQSLLVQLSFVQNCFSLIVCRFFRVPLRSVFNLHLNFNWTVRSSWSYWNQHPCAERD